MINGCAPAGNCCVRHAIGEGVTTLQDVVVGRHIEFGPVVGDGIGAPGIYGRRTVRYSVRSRPKIGDKVLPRPINLRATKIQVVIGTEHSNLIWSGAVAHAASSQR